MGIGAAIAAVCALLLPLLQLFLSKAPERKADETNETIQQNRTDIVNGNVGAIESHIDELLAGQTGAGNSPAGVESAEDVERRLGQF